MKRIILLLMSLFAFTLFNGCGDSSTGDAGTHYTRDEVEFEKETSYNAGYEEGYQAGISEGANNSGEYIDSEDVEDLEDIIDEYAGEYGYHK